MPDSPRKRMHKRTHSDEYITGLLGSDPKRNRNVEWLNTPYLLPAYIFFIALFYVWQTWRASRPAAKPAPAARGPVPVFTPRRASVLGMLCGTLGGFFGVGGAVLAVPIITTVFRLPQTTAQALALSMVIPGSTIALITYTWAGQADWLVGAPLAIGSLLFVPVGVKLAYRLPERKLRACFALMLFATVALLAFES